SLLFDLLLFLIRFPDLLEWSARATDRIVVRQRHGGNVTIGPRTLAGQTAQQVSITPAGIRADYAEIRAALHPLAPHTCRYHDDVTRFHGELPAFFAAELQCCWLIAVEPLSYGPELRMRPVALRTSFPFDAQKVTEVAAEFLK